MATTDRRGASVSATDPPVATNPNPDLAIKAPVLVATTGANIALAGVQTIDGVTVGNNSERVLVKDQTDATTNGIWVAQSGNWQRAVDGQNNSQWTNGTLVLVTGGTVNAGQAFELTAASPVLLGTSAMTFATFAGGGGGLSFVRSAYTSANPVQTSDKGKLVALGGNTLFTLTFNAASGYAATFACLVVNEDAYSGVNTGRAKTIHSSAGDFADFFLWPGQSVVVVNDNNVWKVTPSRQRWAFGLPVFCVDQVLGNAANDGLATGAGALATPLQAFTLARANMDVLGQGARIQLAAQTWTGSLSFDGGVAGGYLYLIGGASGAGASTIWNGTIALKDYVAVNFQDITFAGGAGAGISVDQDGIADVAATVTFGAAGGHMAVANGGVINVTGNYAITGNAGEHFYVTTGGRINGGGASPSIAGGLSFSNGFALGASGGQLNIAGMTFTGAGAGGATTAQRFAFTGGAQLYSGGTDPNTILPGNTAGTVAIGVSDFIALASQVPANTWTYATLQQVAASRLLGNPTGSLANVAEISLGATLAFSGTALQTAALTGDVTAAANSFATTIAANAVSNAKFRQGAGLSVVGVTGSATANVADIVGTASQFLGVNAGGTALAFQTLAGDATLSGPTLTIAANAVTYAKFQQVAASSLVGNATGSLANATGITLGATLAFSGSALQTAAGTSDVTWTANSFVTTVAKIQGTTVSGTTGTGNVVFSAAPTFSGNVAIGPNADSPLTINLNNGATITPITGTNLHIVGADNANNFFVFDSYGGSGAAFLARQAGNTRASPQATAAAQSIFGLSGQGYDGVSAYGVVSALDFISLNQTSTTDHSGYLRFRTVASGSTSIGQVGRFMQGLIVGTSTTDPGIGKIISGSSIIVGTAALATNATDGFLYIPSCAGTPTGVPTSFSGGIPMVYDSTNNKLYVYNGAWKGGTNPGAFT